MNASGIAKMAGVGRAAVSNWRRRHTDFPPPIGGTAASPVFDASAVEQWLRQQGKLHFDSTKERVWRQIESITPATSIGDALCAVGAWLLVESMRLEPASRKASAARSMPPQTPRKLLTQLRAEHKSLADVAATVLPEQWSPQFEAVLDAAVQLRLEHDPGDAFEYLHTQYVSSTRALSGPDATPEAVAEIMLGITGVGERVLDFTSGTGSLLYVAAQCALENGSAARCFAQEIRPQYALITLLRLWFQHKRAVMAGLATEPPVVCVGDSLLDDRFPELSADVVLANPPFGIHDWGHERLAYDSRWTFGLPPRTEPELAWVQHALSHLAPGGTAVLLMPPAAAARPAGRRIRGELVRHGLLRAVIALPAGMLPPAAIGLHLWVLGRPQLGTPSIPRLLFVNSAVVVSPRGSVSRVADTTAVSEVVGRAWRSYVSEPDDPVEEPGVYRVVSAVDVLDERVDLDPRRYLPAPRHAGRDPGQTLAMVGQFGEVLGEIRSGLPQLRVASPTRLNEIPAASIEDLIRSGSASVHRAANRSRGEADVAGRPGETKVLTSADVIAGDPPSGQAPRAEAAVRVEADDVLIPVLARDVIARVATAEQVGAVLGPGVHAVRVSPEVIDPWFLAGVLPRTDNARVAGRASTTAAGMLRIDVRRLTVPVFPIEIQRGYGRVFRQLAQFQVALARAAEQGGALARDIADGLVEGTLVADDHQR